MPDLILTESRQAALRSLLACEPVPGHPLPPQHTFDLLNQLVPCDLLGACFTDPTGRELDEITLAAGTRGRTCVIPNPFGAGHQEGDGAYYLGWVHWSRNPQLAEECNGVAGVDDLAIGFRNGVDHVVQFGFVRESSLFTEEELAMLRMLMPVLGRLVRERPAPAAPTHLTLSERRILHQVAAGRANAEIAASLSVAESTVRKHLENSYRKLGVSNRMAAVARLRGSDHDGVDLRGRIETFATTRMGTPAAAG
jgi:DNA-binding CsgD family transcriptional regulator